MHIKIVVNAGFLVKPQNVLAVSGDPYIDIQCRFDSDCSQCRIPG